MYERWSIPRYVHDKLTCVAFSHTAPGGWAEFGESDCWVYSEDSSYARAPHIKQYMEGLIEASNISGASLDIWHLIEPALKKAGFIDVHKSKFKIPWSAWPKDPHYKEIGKYARIANEAGFASYGVARYRRFLNTSDEEFETLIGKAASELTDKSLHILNDR
jgi:hypothetical protein